MHIFGSRDDRVKSTTCRDPPSDLFYCYSYYIDVAQGRLATHKCIYLCVYGYIVYVIYVRYCACWWWVWNCECYICIFLILLINLYYFEGKKSLSKMMFFFGLFKNFDVYIDENFLSRTRRFDIRKSVFQLCYDCFVFLSKWLWLLLLINIEYRYFIIATKYNL